MEIYDMNTFVVFVLLAVVMGSNAAGIEESIVVRKFSLVTEIGENVLHKDFNRRRLADGNFRRLSLTFHAEDLHFDFRFERAYPIFAKDAKIIMTGSGNGDVDMPPPDVLSFSSAENDAALTFINSTAVNGVIFQHGQAFDVVASDGLLKLSPVRNHVDCGLAPHGDSRHEHQQQTGFAFKRHGRLLRMQDITRWDNCYSTQDKTHVMTMGVGVTTNVFVKQFSKNVADTTAWVASVFARSNVVFRRNMNLVLEVGVMVIVQADVPYKCTDNPTSAKNKRGESCADLTSSRWDCHPIMDTSSFKAKDLCCICGGGTGHGGTPPWNNGGCKMTAQDTLYVFRGVTKQGLWHVFDNCLDTFPSPLGIAYKSFWRESTTNYELELKDGKVYVNGMKNPRIELQEQYGYSDEPRTYVFTSKDPSLKIFIKIRHRTWEPLKTYKGPGITGMGTAQLTYRAKHLSDSQSPPYGSRLYYQLGDNAIGSLSLGGRGKMKVCTEYGNEGLTMYSETSEEYNSMAYESSWKNFAHEVGHNLGGAHPFYDNTEFIKEGETGGIMDYSTTYFGGEIQFGTFSKMNICPVLQKLVSDGTCPYFRAINTHVSRRPTPGRELIGRTLITSTSVSTPSAASTIDGTITCPRCGTFRKSGKVSCCAPGGAWFKNCGGVGSKHVNHRWSEGVKACKPAKPTTTFTPVCRKCGTIKKSGQSTCCGRGGSWFKNCGRAGNAKLHHTWYEGIYACKTRSQSKRVSGQQSNAAQRLNPPNGVDTGSPKAVMTTVKALVFTLANTSIPIPSRMPNIVLVNTSVNKTTNMLDDTFTKHDPDMTNFKTITMTTTTIISKSVNMSIANTSTTAAMSKVSTSQTNTLITTVSTTITGTIVTTTINTQIDTEESIVNDLISEDSVVMEIIFVCVLLLFTITLMTMIYYFMLKNKNVKKGVPAMIS